MTDISYDAPAGALPGYLAVPSGEGPFPAVLVVHEAFGLTDDIRRITDRLAGMGYVAMAPQLFARGTKPLCLVSTLRASMSGQGVAVQDLQAATEWLKARPDTTSKVGVIGFCMGGGFALLLSTMGVVDAAAPSYGRVPGDVAALEQACPVVGSWGGKDRSIPTSAVDGVRAALERGGVPHDIKVYDGAGHSFMNDDALGPLKPVLARVGVGYEPLAAEDAWLRIGGFFAEHLAG